MFRVQWLGPGCYGGYHDYVLVFIYMSTRQFVIDIRSNSKCSCSNYASLAKTMVYSRLCIGYDAMKYS